MQTFGDWMLAVFVLSLLFLTFVYGTMSRWWTSLPGKLFLFEHGMFLAIMLQVLASVLFGQNYPARDQIRNVLYGAGSSAIFSLAFVVLVVQAWERKERRRKAEKRERAIEHEAHDIAEEKAEAEIED